jgi:hypothetical protein
MIARLEPPQLHPTFKDMPEPGGWARLRVKLALLLRAVADWLYPKGF